MDLEVADLSMGSLMRRAAGDVGSPLSNPSSASPRRRRRPPAPRPSSPQVRAALLRRAAAGRRRATADTSLEQFARDQAVAFDGSGDDSVDLSMSGSPTSRARSFLAHQRRSLSRDDLAALLRDFRTPGTQRRASAGPLVSRRQLTALGDDGVRALLDLVDDGLEEFEGTMSASVAEEDSTLTPSPEPGGATGEAGDVRQTGGEGDVTVVEESVGRSDEDMEKTDVEGERDRSGAQDEEEGGLEQYEAMDEDHAEQDVEMEEEQIVAEDRDHQSVSAATEDMDLPGADRSRRRSRGSAAPVGTSERSLTLSPRAPLRRTPSSAVRRATPLSAKVSPPGTRSRLSHSLTTPGLASQSRATAGSTSQSRASPESTTKSRATPGSTSLSRTMPGSTSKSRATPGSTSKSRATPGSASQSRATPESTSKSRATPKSASQSRATPGSTPQSHATPGLASQSRATPGSTSQSRATPESTTKSRATPRTTSQSRIMPGSTSKSRATPGSTSQSRATPGLASQSRATPGSTSRSSATPGSPSQSRAMPGSTSKSRSTPGSTSKSRSTPGSTSKSRAMPGSASQSRATPGLASKSRATSGSPSARTSLRQPASTAAQTTTSAAATRSTPAANTGTTPASDTRATPAAATRPSPVTAGKSTSPASKTPRRSVTPRTASNRRGTPAGPPDADASPPLRRARLRTSQSSVRTQRSAAASAADPPAAEPTSAEAGSPAEDHQATADVTGSDEMRYDADAVFDTPQTPAVAGASTGGARSAQATPRPKATSAAGSARKYYGSAFERFFSEGRRVQTSTPMSAPPRRTVAAAARRSPLSRSLFAPAVPQRTPGRLSLARDDDDDEGPAASASRPRFTSGLIDDPDDPGSDVSEDYPSAGSPHRRSAGSRAAGTPFVPSAESTRLSLRPTGAQPSADGGPSPSAEAGVSSAAGGTGDPPSTAGGTGDPPSAVGGTGDPPSAADRSADARRRRRSLKTSKEGGTPGQERPSPAAGPSHSQSQSTSRRGKPSAREAFARLFPNYEQDMQRRREEAAAKRKRSQAARLPTKRSSLFGPLNNRRWFKRNAAGLRVTSEALREVDRAMGQYEQLVSRWLREVMGPRRGEEPTQSDVLAVLRRSGVAGSESELRRLIRRHLPMEQQMELIRVAECGRLYPVDNPLQED